MFLIIVMGVLPLSQATATHELAAGGMAVDLFLPLGLTNGVKVSYTANGTVDMFFTDDTDDAVSYSLTGIIPVGVLWGKNNSTSGSFQLIYPNNTEQYYLYFGNYNGINPVRIDYDVSPYSGIPGFGLIFVLFSFFALIGLIFLKKQQIH